jgi:hypothetical protein
MSKQRSHKVRKHPSRTSVLIEEQISAIQSMRKLLHKLGDKIDESGWTREQAAEILEIIAVGLSPLIDTELKNPTDDLRVIETHAASQVLTDLASALRDIKHGNVDGRFRAPEGLGGSAYSSSERANVNTFLAFVDWVKSYGDVSYPNAEKSVANTLKTNGTKFRGKPITATNLRSWRRAPPGIKRRSQ